MTRHSLAISPEAILGLEDSALAEPVLQAYLKAEYRIHADAPFSLRVGTYSEALHALYARTHIRSAALITPYNPLGQLLNDHENRLRLEALAHVLVAHGLVSIPAEGLDPQGKWPPEQGALVLDIALEQAREIGREFRQNGVLWCDENAYVALVLLA